MDNISLNKEALLKELITYPFEFTNSSSTTPFSELYSAWADVACIKLKKSAVYYNHFDAHIFQKLKESLCQQLSQLCSSSIAFFLHLYRVEKKLKGETPEERYSFFVKFHLCTPEFLRMFFNQFPILLERVPSLILLWIECIDELLQRLKEDTNEIASFFCHESLPGKVVDIVLPLSDFHHGNRSVIKLVFANGLQLIYKPRSLELDIKYGKFLLKLNELGLHPEMKGCTVLDKKEYGWVECIKQKACASLDEASRFFKRSGMNVCLMFLLGGGDCHYENVIASGEYPVLIDIEALFQPVSPLSPSFINTVLFSGYLPSPGLIENDREISALTAPEELEITTPFWKESGTDHIHLVNKLEKRKYGHRAKIDSEILNPSNFIQDILEGFNATLILIQKNFSLLEEHIESLLTCSGRIMIRSTQFYQKILRRLTDPRVLKYESLEDEIQNLLSLRSLDTNQENIKAILSEETRSLKNFDIPYFSSFPTSCHLFIRDKIVIRDFFHESSSKRIKRLISIDSKTIECQCNLIINALLINRHELNISPYSQYKLLSSSQLLESCQQNSENEFSCLAATIGEKIIQNSLIHSEGQLEWLLIERKTASGVYHFLPISNNLYSGKSGIALFFSALYEQDSSLSAKQWLNYASLLLNRIQNDFFMQIQSSI